ncbi:MAG: hypothetical protein KGI60_00470 [Patescibacteria group bacterium]|nr:hypothetical protein [Patescibacteria group bacterium]
MKAILLLYDEAESRIAVEAVRGQKEKQKVDYRCTCVRNATLEKARRLLRYLRVPCRMKPDETAILTSTHFVAGSDIQRAIHDAIRRFADDDILLFYSGHGGEQSWDLGERMNTRKFVLFKELAGMIAMSARKHVGIIADCCHTLALDRYLADLRKLDGRYLLIGSSQADRVGSENVSLAHPICDAWEFRQMADIRVGKIEKLQHGTVMDIPFNAPYISGGNPDCKCGEEIVGGLTYLPYERPPLRRGSNLDHLFFPPEP